MHYTKLHHLIGVVLERHEAVGAPNLLLGRELARRQPEDLVEDLSAQWWEEDSWESGRESSGSLQLLRLGQQRTYERIGGRRVGGRTPYWREEGWREITPGAPAPAPTNTTMTRLLHDDNYNCVDGEKKSPT